MSAQVTGMGNLTDLRKCPTRVRCILAGAALLALLVYAAHRIGVQIVKWRHPEGSGR